MMKEIWYEPVSYLRVEYEITNKVELADKCRGILTEIMKDFHDLVRFHDFLETICEWINCF